MSIELEEMWEDAEEADVFWGREKGTGALWKIKGPFYMKEIRFGELEYDSKDVAEITLTQRYSDHGYQEGQQVPEPGSSAPA